MKETPKEAAIDGKKGNSEKSPKSEAERDYGGKVMLDDFYRMGRYMMVVCILAQLLLLVEVGDLLFMTYAGAEPKVRKCGNHTFPAKMKAEKRCDILEQLWRNGKGEQQNCTKESITEKELDFQFSSVNVEFDQLYCHTSTVKMSMSVQVAGIIPGSILFGWLSDAYGRRPVMFGCLLCWICSMVATTFTSSLLWFTIARFIVCFFNAGIAATLIVFTAEMYPQKHRFVLMNLIAWAPNYILFGAIAYFFEEWRLLQRVLAMMALPCVVLICFLDESPRFLISARKIAEAKKAIMRMYKFDGKHCDEAQLDKVLERERQQMEELSKRKKKYNYWHLFYSFEFTLYTSSVAFSLAVGTLTTYGLIYHMEKLSGSIYINLMLMGAFKYSMNLLVAWADRQFKWLGRKMAHLISELLVVAVIALYVIFHLTGVNLTHPYLGTAMVVAAVGFGGVLPNAAKLSGNELYPTGVRNLSTSFGQVCSRIGVVGAPLIFFLKDVCANEFCTILPYLLLILISSLDAAFYQIVIRETKDQPLISEFPPKKKTDSPTLTANDKNNVY